MSIPTILMPDRPDFHTQQWQGIQPLFYGVQLPTHLPKVDGLIAWGMPAPLRREALALPNLKWVLTLTAGVDNWLPDLPDTVNLYNAHTLHDDAVAQHGAALILAAARGLHRFARATKWQKAGPLHTLLGREVVIWGYGHIGHKLEKLLSPFGARVTGLGSRSTPAEIDAALSKADDLIVLLPLTEKTRHIINSSTLSKLKAGAWLYNIGRGELVNTADLLAALEHLGGAALDVTSPEPLPAQHLLFTHPKVLITPHIASTTDDLPQRGAQFAADFVGKMQRGQTLDNLVERRKGY